MTKEELMAKVITQKNIIRNAEKQMHSDIQEYLKSLPYKVGDKVSYSRCGPSGTGIISSISLDQRTNLVEVRVNPLNVDGTHLSRTILYDIFERSDIKKID